MFVAADSTPRLYWKIRNIQLMKKFVLLSSTACLYPTDTNTIRSVVWKQSCGHQCAAPPTERRGHNTNGDTDVSVDTKYVIKQHLNIEVGLIQQRAQMHFSTSWLIVFLFVSHVSDHQTNSNIWQRYADKMQNAVFRSWLHLLLRGNDYPNLPGAVKK